MHDGCRSGVDDVVRKRDCSSDAGQRGSMGRLFGKRKRRAMGCVAWLFVARAQAQTVPEQSVDLKYEVDPTLTLCPNVAEFRAMVAQQLGYDPYRIGSPLGVDVRVLPAGAGIEGIIAWNISQRSGMGERRFAARRDDCREMVAAVGFVVAVQIQLMATEHAAESHSRLDGSEPVVRRAVQSSQTTSDHRDTDVKLTLQAFEPRRPLVLGDSRWTVAAGIGASGGFGLGPDPVALGRLSFSLWRGWLGFEAGAEASLPSETREAYGGGFQHGLILGTLAGCGSTRSISACGLAKLGRIQVHGLGIDKPASPHGLVVQVGPRLAYSFGLTDHLALVGRVDALYLVTSWTVDLNHMAVWRMPRFGTVVGIDMLVRFQ
jgi:hypothetical protein